MVLVFNCQLIAASLEKNTTLLSLNLESNFLTNEGIMVSLIYQRNVQRNVSCDYEIQLLTGSLSLYCPLLFVDLLLFVVIWSQAIMRSLEKNKTLQELKLTNQVCSHDALPHSPTSIYWKLPENN